MTDQDPMPTDARRARSPRGTWAARRPRGVGRVYQPTYRDKKTGALRTVATWWIQYNHRGQTWRESSHSTVRADAVRLLKRRLGEIGRGKLVGPREERVTFADLAAGLVHDYRLQRRRSLSALVGRLEPDGRLDLNTVGGRLRHLADFFGVDPAIDITGDRIRAYQEARRTAGATAASVNRETAALSRMFTLAIKDGRLGTRPPFPERLQEAPPRQGFFEPPEYQAVRTPLPGDHQDELDFAYWSGWRPGAIRELTWPEVDLDAQIIRSGGGHRRSGAGFSPTPTTRPCRPLSRADWRSAGSIRP